MWNTGDSLPYRARSSMAGRAWPVPHTGWMERQVGGSRRPPPTGLVGAAVVVGGAVLLIAALVLAAVPAARTLVPGLPPDCEVAAGGGDPVGLDADQAERAGRLGAAAVRRGERPPALAADLRRELDLATRDALPVARAVTGRARHALTCRDGGSAEEEPDRLDARGLTGRAAAVRADVTSAFGRQRLGGFAPGGVSTGHQPGSAHYDGRALDLFFRPATRAQKVRGWAMAQYLVSQGRRLAVATVIYDGRIWTARRADEGWRDYRVDTSGRSAATAAVLEHRDHVHVDVSD